MKLRIVITVCCMLLALSACRKETENSTDKVTITETEDIKVSLNSEQIKNCEDFLNTYETWTNELIELMAKHKDDPVTLVTSPEYIKTMTEGVGFLQDWETIALSCSQDKLYSERMDAIQERIEKKQKELGLK